MKKDDTEEGEINDVSWMNLPTTFLVLHLAEVITLLTLNMNHIMIHIMNGIVGFEAIGFRHKVNFWKNSVLIICFQVFLNDMINFL